MEAAVTGPVLATAASDQEGAKKLPRVGSAVAVIADDAVLLGVRNKEPHRGKLVLPGGKVRPFESIHEAAEREILEETGIKIEVERQIGVWEIIEPPAEHRVIVYSQARPVGGELRAATDLSDARYYLLDELDELDLTDTVRAVLRQIRSDIKASSAE
jgi:ADP-ribose pyrophosphatase YjhB (NUDIX family)